MHRELIGKTKIDILDGLITVPNDFNASYYKAWNHSNMFMHLCIINRTN